jgi:uncharacterized membrane protein
VQTLKLFALVLPVFLITDLFWLGVVMKNFYNHEIGTLARRNGPHLAPRWLAAMFVYLLIPAGLVVFVRPILGESAPPWRAFAWGAAFGIVLYGVYDFTNLSILEKWTLRMTLVDIAWGAVLCGTMSVVMSLLDHALTRP